MSPNNPMQWGKMPMERAQFSYANAESVCQRLQEVMVDTLGIAQAVSLATDTSGKPVLQVNLGQHSPINPRPMRADFMGIPIQYINR